MGTGNVTTSEFQAHLLKSKTCLSRFRAPFALGSTILSTSSVETRNFWTPLLFGLVSGAADAELG